MTLKQRIKGFAEVGLFINRHFSGQHRPDEARFHEGLNKVIEVAHTYNNWFVPNFVNDAISNIGSYLNEQSLTDFARPVKELSNEKTVAVIAAGNIPMVGFHDLLCVLLSGHKCLLKMSSDDNVLLPFFLKLLTHYEPLFENKILFADGKLSNFDAVIATGSDNTANHFKYYFSKYPHIIRKNRTSVAVLTGKETKEELRSLGTDIFQYFGLGCRNVSKILVPAGYSFNAFFEAIVDFGWVVNNKKYGNNYDYHRAIYMLESMQFLDNNFLMVRESSDLYSPVGAVFYQYYNNSTEIKDYLESHKDQIQCVVGKDYIPLGYSQRPVISDFADNVNTLEFLVTL
ncbi:MAG: acyl-CoA reductase [Bacteroidia bacterium]|nr:acyl-CoA reductase [Bacteroidia bacterium]